MDNTSSFPVPKKWLIAGGIVLAVILIFVVWPLASMSSTKSTGVDKETALSALYRDNQNYLSSYIAGFYEQTGVAQAKADKLNAILLDAVKGRYDGHTSAQPGNGQLFGAIQEAYPDLTALNIYDKIVNYIQAGRAGFRDRQSALLDKLRDYDKWRKSGLFHPMWVSLAGFPSDSLEARVNGQPTLTGAAAEDKMKQLVLVGQASQSYQTGTDQILTVPGSTPTTPTTTTNG